MSLTTIDRIRHHLSRINAGSGEVRGQTVRLISDGYVALPHTHIVSESETVKSPAGDVPVSETLAAGSVPAALIYPAIIPGTTVCAQDSSLSRLYQENIDYLIDYAAGTVARIDGGAIADGATVIIWYQHYVVYQRGLDYVVDYDGGRIRRTGSGNIAAGQEVLIDYRLGITPLSDDEIQGGIEAAEAEISHAVASDFRESTDPALQTAATFLTLSHLCRNAAALAASGGGTSNQSQSSFWLTLAASYRETAERLLTWFRQSAPGLRPPRLA
jgi:hypothetical protein